MILFRIDVILGVWGVYWGVAFVCLILDKSSFKRSTHFNIRTNSFLSACISPNEKQ